MIVGFTGTREGMTAQQKRKVLELLLQLTPNFAVDGACVGADKDFNTICRELFINSSALPGHSKGDPGNTKFRNDGIYNLSTHSRPFLDRNNHIVDISDILIACPKTEDTSSGGTWYTIKRATKAKLPLYVVYPDGVIVVVNILEIKHA